MKTVVRSGRGHHMARIGILSIVVALVAGTAGCASSATEYDLTISSTEGGVATIPGEGTFVHDEGDVVDLAATPDASYVFINWTGDVDTIEDVNDATTSITMDDNYSVTANFVLIVPAQYDLLISSTVGGEVTDPGEGIFDYEEGTVVSLVATSEPGYQFVDWIGDVANIADVNDATTTIAMHGNCSITANFKEGESVIFADPNLEAAIRETIGIPEGSIYPSDLEELTSLSASERGISDLVGLELCRNLMEQRGAVASA